MNEESTPPEPARKGLTWILCLGLVGGTAGLWWWIVGTAPEAEQSTATRRTPMLVEVTVVEKGSFQPRIEVLGRVDPAREIRLQSQIRGEVIRRPAAFDPGGRLDRGDLLLELQPADYRNALGQRRSALDQARAELQLEMGRQKVAESDLELLESIDAAMPELDPGLVLREPQLQAAKARIRAAEAAVAQAQLDLERTRIAAPFPLQVLERNVDLGSQVAPGDDLGRLVGIEEYWITASVPLRCLPRIEFRGEGDSEGTQVEIRNPSAWPEGVHRVGVAERRIGNLNDQTRLARVLVSVADPLALDPAQEDAPPLILGSIVECTLIGKSLDQVVRVDRSLLRGRDTVWVMDEEDRLHLAEVEIAFQDSRHAYVASGLEDGARVVTTDLATIQEGAPLRLKGGGK
jgi:RND family efflux transporter MFP subunit